MNTNKRPRGRPRGSGKNDSPYLAQVVDVLVRDPSLKATTAMKRVIRGGKDWDATDATLIRRWQSKWKNEGTTLMAVARERARPNHSISFQDFIYSLGAFQRQVEQTMRHPDFQRTLTSIASFKGQLEEQLKQPAFQLMIEQMVAWRNQFEKALQQPDFQRLIEWQRQVERAKLVGPFNSTI